MGGSDRLCDVCGLREWTQEKRWPIGDGGGFISRVCDECAESEAKETARRVLEGR